MRNRVSLALAGVAAGLVLAVAAQAAPEIKWEKSYAKGIATAKQQNKPIMVDFFTEG
jgi:hypothetical protein